MTHQDPPSASIPIDHSARWGRAYLSTHIPDEPTPWSRLDPASRSRLITGIWVVVTALLVAGWFDARAFIALVGVSVVHALYFLYLVGFRPLVFPAQLRIAYLGVVALGTFVPELRVLLVIATAGAFALLLFDYCPLARLLYLLPWNRSHELTPALAWRVFITPPGPGRFQIAPERVSQALGTAKN